MKKLHIFLIKSFLGPFITTFFIALFILLMQFLWKYIDDLVGKGLDITEIINLLFYAIARFVPLALPMATLLSSVMVIGKLSENNELTALKASGVSFIRIIQPLILIVCIISTSSFLFSNYIMPIANLKSASMIYDIQKKKPALNIKEDIFYDGIEGFSLKIGEKLSDGKTIKDIIIYDHTNNNGNDKLITAESGFMQITEDDRFLEITLYNGNSYINIAEKNKKQKDAHRRSSFEENIVRFDLASFNKRNNSEKLYKGHYAMLNNHQLNIAIDSLNIKLQEKNNKIKENVNKHYSIYSEKEDNLLNTQNNTEINKKEIYNLAIHKLKTLISVTKNNKNEVEYRNIIITKHKVEWHRKICLAVACILFFFIGSPLGSLIKKGGFGLPTLISVFFFLIYHVLSMIGEKAAKDLSIEVYQGMWLTHIVLLPITLLLMYIAINERSIPNISQLKLAIFANTKNKS